MLKRHHQFDYEVKTRGMIRVHLSYPIRVGDVEASGFTLSG